MPLISKSNKGICNILCVIYSKCAWVVPLKDKKDITITNAFQKFLDRSGRKPNILWSDKGSEFYSRLLKSCLQDNEIVMYSTHSDGKAVVIERFIKERNL